MLFFPQELQVLCRFCFSHRNFGCFDLVCLIVSSTCVIFPIGITVICNIICSWMGHTYAATPGQNPGVARIYIYVYIYMYIYIIYGRCQNYKTEVEAYEGTVIYRTLLFHNSVLLGRYEKTLILTYSYFFSPFYNSGLFCNCVFPHFSHIYQFRSFFSRSTINFA